MNIDLSGRLGVGDGGLNLLHFIFWVGKYLSFCFIL